MDYSTIVQTISKLPILRQGIEQMVNRTFAVNLVVDNWKNVLEKYEVHKAHLQRNVRYSKGHACVEDKAHVRNIISPKHCYNVIVAGYFSISVLEMREISFIVRQCEPLTEIGNAMKDGNCQNLHDGARLFVEECNPAMCSACIKSHRDYNVPLCRRNWCVLKTRVFNGETINNIFKHHLEQTLTKGTVFMAVMCVQIYSRTTFGNDAYKISGKVKDMIVFQESVLSPREDLDFGLLIKTPLPSVEYILEDAVEECIPTKK